jgi:hypothetical protein
MKCIGAAAVMEWLADQVESREMHPVFACRGKVNFSPKLEKNAHFAGEIAS